MGSCFDRDKECPLVEIEEEKIIPDRFNFLKRLSKEELNAGYIKFNIPDDEDINNTSAEGVWGWVTPEDRLKYEDNNFFGNITAILCNNPLNFFEKLRFGSEVLLKCNGDKRPTLDPGWMTEYLL